MFVAMFFLLNKYVPEMREGIIKEAHALHAQTVVAKDKAGSTERVEVSISPDRQKIDRRELQELDRNKYHVDESVEIALRRRHQSGWSIGTVQSFDTIGAIDLPIVEMGLSAFRTIGQMEARNRPIFAIRDEKVRVIGITKDSEVAGVRVGTNPYGDEALVRRMVEAQISMAARLSNEFDDPEKRKMVVDHMTTVTMAGAKPGFDAYLTKVLPAQKRIQNGVYVTVFELVNLPTDALLGALFNQMSVLDRALQFLVFKGSIGGTGRNIKVDQKGGIASFDGSVRLRDVTVDGSKTDVTLNDIGFVVAGKTRIVLVQLICLDLDGLSTSLFLKDVMDSLLFVL